MTDKKSYGRSKAGVELTDEVLERMAREAEAGLRPQRTRRHSRAQHRVLTASPLRSRLDGRRPVSEEDRRAHVIRHGSAGPGPSPTPSRRRKGMISPVLEVAAMLHPAPEPVASLTSSAWWPWLSVGPVGRVGERDVRRGAHERQRPGGQVAVAVAAAAGLAGRAPTASARTSAPSTQLPSRGVGHRLPGKPSPAREGSHR